MGQKVNAHGNRVGIIKDWDTKWYADKKNFATNLKQDDDIRKFIKKNYYKSAISKITIERAANKVTVNIHTGRPATIIGKQGAGVETMKKEVQKFCPERNVNINVIEVKRPDMDAQLVAERIGKTVNLNIFEVKSPDLNAQLVAEKIALDLENRVSFRRAMKSAIARAMKLGAKGIKVKAGGRLGGAEIARSENYHEGSVPLQTLRADIDYGFAEAKTTFGQIGVKVWIYKGEVLGGVPREEVTTNVNA